MQLFFIATWKSAILVSTAAAVVSCCYGYNSFLLVNKNVYSFVSINKLFQLFPGFLSNKRYKIAQTECSKITLAMFTNRNCSVSFFFLS